jgi:hypothetical protein
MQRTALYEALFLSSKLFKGSHSKEKIAILLTDGIDNAGSVPLEVAMNRAKNVAFFCDTPSLQLQAYKSTIYGHLWSTTNGLS